MKKLIIGAVALAIVIVGASFAYERFSEDYVPQEQAGVADDGANQQPQAPDFMVFDMNGNRVKLSDFKGKPVIVNFWATWCGFCVQEMPAFDAVYKEYGDEVEFLIVNLPSGESAGEIKSFINEGGYTFPVYIDSENSAAVAYGVTSLPSTVVVDKDGFIAAARAGMLNEEQIRQYAEAVINN